MKVCIKLVAYFQPTYNVEQNITISKLKPMIEDTVGIPRANFALKFNEKTLENAMTLSHYNIRENSVLDIYGNLLATLHPRFIQTCRMDNTVYLMETFTEELQKK